MSSSVTDYRPLSQTSEHTLSRPFTRCRRSFCWHAPPPGGNGSSQRGARYPSTVFNSIYLCVLGWPIRGSSKPAEPNSSPRPQWRLRRLPLSRCVHGPTSVGRCLRGLPPGIAALIRGEPLAALPKTDAIVPQPPLQPLKISSIVQPVPEVPAKSKRKAAVKPRAVKAEKKKTATRSLGKSVKKPRK